MKLSRRDLEWVVSEGVISRGQAEALWRALEGRDPERPRYDLPHVAYYFGALVVISAMGWFMTLGWERFGGRGNSCDITGLRSLLRRRGESVVAQARELRERRGAAEHAGERPGVVGQEGCVLRARRPMSLHPERMDAAGPRRLRGQKRCRLVCGGGLRR